MQSGRSVDATGAVLMPRSHAGGARNGFPRSEDLDDAHRGTAVRADERGGMMASGAAADDGFDRGGNDVQQFARLGEMLAAPGIGQQAIVANAVEAAGQDVQQEATHELVGCEGHGPVPRLSVARSPSNGR